MHILNAKLIKNAHIKAFITIITTNKLVIRFETKISSLYVYPIFYNIYNTVSSSAREHKLDPFHMSQPLQPYHLYVDHYPIFCIHICQF